MKDNFLEWMQQNRERMDTEQPGAKVWAKLQQKLPVQVRPAKRKSIYARLAMAASIAGLIALTLVFIKKQSGNRELAHETRVPIKAEQTIINPGTPDTGTTVAVTIKPPEENRLPPPKIKPAEKRYAEPKTRYIGEPELIQYFAGMVMKQNKKLEHIAKDDPNHGQFLDNLKMTDSAYRRLEAKLQRMPHNKQLLEAISELLQVQLNMINQQINHFKQLKSKKNENINNRT
jgi:hypothetical protein